MDYRGLCEKARVTSGDGDPTYSRNCCLLARSLSMGAARKGGADAREFVNGCMNCDRTSRALTLAEPGSDVMPVQSSLTGIAFYLPIHEVGLY